MHRLALSLAWSALLLCTLTPVAWTQGAGSQRWIGTWVTSPLRPDPVGPTDAAVLSRTGFEDQTLRQIVSPHLSGSTLRVRLENTFGDSPLSVGPVHIGLQAEGASIVAGSDRPLAFGGQPGVTIPAGAQ